MRRLSDPVADITAGGARTAAGSTKRGFFARIGAAWRVYLRLVRHDREAAICSCGAPKERGRRDCAVCHGDLMAQ
jgi:hypothetical protein